jgi:hypothetical protein
MRRILLATISAIVLGGPAVAGDVALIVGNDRYQLLDRVRSGGDISRAISDYEALGFQVFGGANVNVGTLAGMSNEFARASGDATACLWPCPADSYTALRKPGSCPSMSRRAST